MAGASYTFQEHLIERQAKAEEELLKELRSGNYTIHNPIVRTNFYFIAPLTAVIAFCTEEETAVTVTVLGKTKEGNITHTFPKTKEHVLPVMGLYPEYTNQVELREYRGDSHVVEIEMEKPDCGNGFVYSMDTTPEYMQDNCIFLTNQVELREYRGDSHVVEIEMEKPDCGNGFVYSMDTTPEYMQDNCIFLTPSSGEKASAYDYAGDLRWCLNIKCVFDMKRLKNGHILMGTDRLIQMPYYMSGLYEISLCGKIYKEYKIFGGSHHDAFEMPDGNLLCLTEDLRSDTVEDMCILIDRESGAILKTWDYKDAIQPGLGKSGSWSEKDWFHNNAVWYDENTNSLTFSGRHVDAMINLDFDTGKLNWIIGDPEGWPKEMVDKYFFKPIGNNFGWQYEQHACLITPNGDVMCFDNHHWGSKNKEKFLAAKNNYSRGVRYRINTKEMTIEQVWEYGKDLGAEFFSPYISNVEYYNEGHYMVHSGGIAYNKDGGVSEALGAYEPMMGGSLESITIEVCDNKPMMRLHAKGNYYRAEKMKLYGENEVLELGKGQIVGELGVTKDASTPKR